MGFFFPQPAQARGFDAKKERGYTQISTLYGRLLIQVGAAGAGLETARMPPITPRQEALLGTIINQYVMTAKPVSSGQLVDQPGLDVSPATVRNDMAALTEAGMLQQPHTSAGRVPTESAWRWYLDRDLPDRPLPKTQQTALKQLIDQYGAHPDELLRHLAKAMAEMAEESVLVAFDKNDTFYTGVSNLFQHPEFEHIDLMQNLTQVIDHLDDVVGRIYPKVGQDVTVWIGKENPFSAICGTIIARYRLRSKREGLFGIIGPMRQDYPNNVALVRFTQSLLQTV